MSQDSELLYPRNLEPTKDMEILPMSQKSAITVSAPNAPKAVPLLLGPDNTVTICPFCSSNIKTSVKFRSTTRTHITAALCCLICWYVANCSTHYTDNATFKFGSSTMLSCCCCCIPYCLDSAKNTDHYCPSCSNYIGTYEK